jgi:hypothetical protein
LADFQRKGVAGRFREECSVICKHGIKLMGTIVGDHSEWHHKTYGARCQVDQEKTFRRAELLIEGLKALRRLRTSDVVQ